MHDGVCAKSGSLEAQRASLSNANLHSCWGVTEVAGGPLRAQLSRISRLRSFEPYWSHKQHLSYNSGLSTRIRSSSSSFHN